VSGLASIFTLEEILLRGASFRKD
jgi:hypothetical protein